MEEKSYGEYLKFQNVQQEIHEQRPNFQPVSYKVNSVIYDQQHTPAGPQLQQVVVQPVMRTAQSVVPSVVPVEPAQPVVLQPVMDTTNYYLPQQNQQPQVVYISQINQQQPLQALQTIEGTAPINSGACSMLNDAKITALISETRKDVNKVTIPAASNSVPPSGLILDLTDEQGYAWDVYFKMEEIIYRYRSVISNVYNNYINNNPNKGVLNEKFQDFSNELMNKIFDVITKYNKLYSFCDLDNKRAKNQLSNSEDISKYNELLNENGTGENKLFKEVYVAINEANGLLKSKLNEFNSSLKASKQQRASELFFPNSSNSEEQSVDDMAIDDCVFSKSNIDKIFPKASNMDSTDYDAREVFLKKLGIGEDDLSNAQFVCNINTFTDALLEAAQSAINNEYNEPSQDQYGCIRNCIKNAFVVAQDGWNIVNKVFKQLNNSIDGRVKRIVIERYQAIFKNISQFIFSYDNYLNNKLKEAHKEQDKQKISIINKLIGNNREMLKGLKVPKEINNGVVINNNVSQIGLNYEKFQGNSLDDLFK